MLLSQAHAMAIIGLSIQLFQANCSIAFSGFQAVSGFFFIAVPSFLFSLAFRGCLARLYSHCKLLC